MGCQCRRRRRVAPASSAGQPPPSSAGAGPLPPHHSAAPARAACDIMKLPDPKSPATSSTDTGKAVAQMFRGIFEGEWLAGWLRRTCGREGQQCARWCDCVVPVPDAAAAPNPCLCPPLDPQ